MVQSEVSFVVLLKLSQTITCTTNMHVTIQNHHLHYKYAYDCSEPSHMLEVIAYLGQMGSDSAYMASVNKLV